MWSLVAFVRKTISLPNIINLPVAIKTSAYRPMHLSVIFYINWGLVSVLLT